MFTGLVEEIGKISAVSPIGKGLRVTVEAKKIMDDLHVDDSVAINGVCQTVVSHSSSQFTVEAVEETTRKTNFAQLRAGTLVNLERSMRPDGRLGGHIVQGHVDTTGKIIQIIPETAGTLVKVNFPAEFRKYVPPLGSISINGISLTIARAESNNFTLSVIPHTFNQTTLSTLQVGAVVNIEFDILGKYIENLMRYGNSAPTIQQSDDYGAYYTD